MDQEIAKPSNELNTILIIEDDEKLAGLVGSFLEKNGFEVHYEINGIEGVRVAKELAPALILLDIMLPGLDGLSVCRELRKFYFGQILMLTALSDGIDEVTGLEIGADGYLAKPVKPRVLLAHIRAHLRQNSSLAEVASEYCDLVIVAGELSIDAKKRLVKVRKQEKKLTSAEFDLLWLLAKNRGTIVERETLHEKIFRIEYDGLDRNIDIRISKLRKKLGEDPKHPALIKTVRGKGYLLAS